MKLDPAMASLAAFAWILAIVVAFIPTPKHEAPIAIPFKTSPVYTLTVPMAPKGETKWDQVLLSGHKPNPETRRIHREMLAMEKL